MYDTIPEHRYNTIRNESEQRKLQSEQTFVNLVLIVLSVLMNIRPGGGFFWPFGWMDDDDFRIFNS